MASDASGKSPHTAAGPIRLPLSSASPERANRTSVTTAFLPAGCAPKTGSSSSAKAAPSPSPARSSPAPIAAESGRVAARRVCRPAPFLLRPPRSQVTLGNALVPATSLLPPILLILLIPSKNSPAFLSSPSCPSCLNSPCLPLKSFMPSCLKSACLFPQVLHVPHV